MELIKAVGAACKMYTERNRSKMEDGDEFVAVFNNCVMVIALEDGKLSAHVICDEPYTIDADVDEVSDE